VPPAFSGTTSAGDVDRNAAPEESRAVDLDQAPAESVTMFTNKALGVVARKVPSAGGDVDDIKLFRGIKIPINANAIEYRRLHVKENEDLLGSLVALQVSVGMQSKP